MSKIQADPKNWFEISGNTITTYYVYGASEEAALHVGVVQGMHIPSKSIVSICNSKLLSVEELAILCAARNGSITGIDLTISKIYLKTLTV